MGLKITLDSIALPGKGILNIEGSETEVRVLSPKQYLRVFPEMQETFSPKTGSVAVLVIRQKMKGKWVQTAHFIGGRSSGQHNDILLDGLVVGKESGIPNCHLCGRPLVEQECKNERFRLWACDCTVKR